ncbi:MAG: hypothetical protein K1X72_20075 [Pyrinomonadaceae bacterium]|nr:hypothetical protein [Pyrinomonadaceae bacterium]
MNKNLVVNPFLKLESIVEPDALIVLSVPNPDDGLRRLQISKFDQPNLHEVFLDLAQTKFDFLDVERDIDEAERELLFKFGVLLEAENIPQKVLFECLLDGVKSEEFDGDITSLIVNPTFRYEPFDFTKFRSRVHGQHLSPHHPSVWIKQPLTDIEIGYWFSNQQAETVAKFKAGEKLSVEVKPDFLSKLVASEILTTPEKWAKTEKKQSEAIAEAKIKYREDKYVVLRKILPDAQMKAMRRYYRQYIDSGFMPFGDGQVERRFYQHNEPLARVIHQNLAKLMSLVIGEEVIPSYVYAASYIEDAILQPHTDRAQCEFSISFQIDYLPEQENKLSPWGLFVWEPDFAEGKPVAYDSRKFPAASEEEDKNPKVYLASGDGLVYKGRELIHYRYPLPQGHQSTSLFFHYVAKDFEGGLN